MGTSLGITNMNISIVGLVLVIVIRNSYLSANTNIASPENICMSNFSTKHQLTGAHESLILIYYITLIKVTLTNILLILPKVKKACKCILPFIFITFLVAETFGGK